MSDICVKSFSSSFQPFVMFSDDRWQPDTGRGSECAAAPSWVSNSCLYHTSFFPVSWLPIPLPTPWGNMAFEVNTICFVAFLWWLNNGLKYAAKWESEAGDGSNLAFLSERWHRPIEINESAGVLTLSLLQEKQHLPGSVLFTLTNSHLLTLLLHYISISTKQVWMKKYCSHNQDIRNKETIRSPISPQKVSQILF